MRRKLAISLGLIVIICMMLVLPINEVTPQIQNKTAQFIIASWDYPDADGQGIQYVKVYNGSQLLETWDSNDITTIEINPDTNLTLSVACWINTDVLWILDFEECKNYIQHSVIVSTPLNSSVFNQQNFTYTSGGGTGDPMFYYWYDVILDISFVSGTIYTAVLTYEIYY